MRWGRRRGRGIGSVAKRHYAPAGAAALCKKEYDAAIYITENHLAVTCKSCIKKLIKEGIAVLDDYPSYLHPATTTTAKKEPNADGEFKMEDFKNDYLKRLGLFHG